MKQKYFCAKNTHCTAQQWVESRVKTPKYVQKYPKEISKKYQKYFKNIKNFKIIPK
jgi:hypothetical protein